MKVWNIDIESALSVISSVEKDEIIQEANRLLDGIFTFTSRWDMERCEKKVVNPSFDHIEDNDPEWLYQNNRHAYMESVALSFLLTKDSKYLDFFVSFISSWIDSCPFSEDKRNGVWRSLEIGIRSVNWLFCLQLLRPYLSDEFILKVENSLLLHAKLLVSTYGTFHRLSNWGVLQDEGLFSLGVYFDNKEWIDLALKRLTYNISNSVMDDGSHWEQSPMYTGEVFNCFLTVLNIAKQHKIAVPKLLEEKSLKMAIALTYFMKQDGVLYTFGDTDAIDAKDLIAFSAVVLENGYLKFIGDNDGLKKIYFHCSKEQIAKYLELEIVEKRGSKALLDSKNYFLNSGKFESLFSAGCLGSGHGHADNLSLCVAYDGHDILIDPGRYTYKNEAKRLELKKASSHNTYTIDDVEFTEPLETWAYKDIALSLASFNKFSDKADIVEGSHLGYKNALCKRSVIRLEDEVLLIFDTVYSKGKHFVKANFNFAPNLNLKIQNNKVDYGGGSIASALESEISLTEYDYSFRYNELKQSVKAIFKTDFEESAIIPYIMDIKGCVKDYSVSKITLQLGQKELNIKEGIALKINTTTAEYVVMFIEKDVIGPVDLFSAFGYEGYGRIIVFKEGEKILIKY